MISLIHYTRRSLTVRPWKKVAKEDVFAFLFGLESNFSGKKKLLNFRGVIKKIWLSRVYRGLNYPVI